MKPRAVVVNLSTSGSRLGGAAVAAEWHARHMAPHYPLELWRMWDEAEVRVDGPLTIRHFPTHTRPRIAGSIVPAPVRGLLMDSTLIDEVLDLRPAIIHIQNPLPALAFERLARRAADAGINVVVSTHGFFEVMHPVKGLGRARALAWNRWITDPIVRSFRYIDAFASGYPNERRLLTGRGVPEERIHLVPNGIDPGFEESPPDSAVQAVRRRFDLPPGIPILLFIGNHTPNKGIDTVMGVAGRLRTPATVVIGGRLQSPEEPRQRLARHPPADGVRVIFTDYLEFSEQQALYHMATMLLFPSVADTLPLTVLEAMACGLAVIAYDVGGIRFQLDDGSGVVVPPGDTDALISEVESLLSNPQERVEMGAAAVRRQRNHFTWDVAAKRTLAIYDQLLEQDPAGNG